MTTATLRRLAYDAAESGRFQDAADLYEKALAAYPDGCGQLHVADKANLERRAGEARELSRVV